MHIYICTYAYNLYIHICMYDDILIVPLKKAKISLKILVI